MNKRWANTSTKFVKKIKPEKLRYRDGWSRSIDEKNRLVYDIDEHGYIYIISCEGHY